MTNKIEETLAAIPFKTAVCTKLRVRCRLKKCDTIIYHYYLGSIIILHEGIQYSGSCGGTPCESKMSTCESYAKGVCQGRVAPETLETIP